MEDEAPKADQAKKPIRRRQTAVVLLIILLIAAIVVSAFLFIQYRKARGQNPSAKQAQLTTELGKLVELPSEQPLISTVLNSSKLTNRTLAHEARNGDQIFIFAKSKRLILYRPSDKKVVDMLNIQTR